MRPARRKAKWLAVRVPRPLLAARIIFLYGGLLSGALIVRNEMESTVNPKTRYVAYGGVFMAISVLLSFFSVYFGPNLKISLAPVIVIYAGAVMGPVAGAIIGAATDILVLFIKPLPGAYFAGFTLTMALYGFLGGVVFKARDGASPGMRRIILGTLFIQSICSLLINTAWLCVLSNVAYGPTLVARLPLSLIADALYTVILVFLVRFQRKILPRATFS